MTTYKAGLIGCGGRGRAHAEGYQAADNVLIAACSDSIEATRQSLTQDFDVANSYYDYREMLAKEDLDLVSVCTWTGQHREMVEAAAQSKIKAIHCEKPMASNWGDAKALYHSCVDNDVLITFCHQRRFGSSFVKAPDTGPYQALRQAGADTGAAEGDVVQLVNDGFSCPANGSIVRVTITQN